MVRAAKRKSIERNVDVFREQKQKLPLGKRLDKDLIVHMAENNK